MRLRSDGAWRRSLITAAVGLALLAGPAVAHAAGGTITFIRDGQVWAMAPDGSGPRRLSADGSDYLSPTLADDGRVFAGHRASLSVFALGGGRVGGPFALEITTASVGTTGPVSVDADPSGTRVAFWYFWHSTWGGGYYTSYVALANSDGPTSATGIKETGQQEAPRWIGTTGRLVLISENGDTVSTWDAATAPQPFLTAPAGTGYSSVDVAPNGVDVLLARHADGVSSGPVTLELRRAAAVPPAATSPICTLDGFGRYGSRPRWSPDGTAITWADDHGVWVSPAPAGSGTCALSPRLVAAGDAPDWGAAEWQPPAPAAPAPVPAPAGAGTQRSAAAITGGGPSLSITATTGRKLGRALSRGLRLTVAAGKAGRVRAVATLGSRDARRYRLRGTTGVAQATSTVRQGRTTLTLRFTKAARKALRRARKVTLTVAITIEDAAGRRTSRTLAVTLRR